MSLKITLLLDDVEGVPGDALLYRRIVWSKIGGRTHYVSGDTPSLNGNCFTDWPAAKALDEGFPGPCMSVGVSTVLDELGCTANEILAAYPECGLACVRAADLRGLTKADGAACPQGIMLAPTEKEPWHGVVFDMSGQRGSAAKAAIARVASWIVPLINDEQEGRLGRADART